MKALGVGLIIWITHFSTTASKKPGPRLQLNYCQGLTLSSPWRERGVSECLHHHFSFLSFHSSVRLSRLCFSKRCLLASGPPNLTMPNITGYWASENWQIQSLGRRVSPPMCFFQKSTMQTAHRDLSFAFHGWWKCVGSWQRTNVERIISYWLQTPKRKNLRLTVPHPI